MKRFYLAAILSCLSIVGVASLYSPEIVHRAEAANVVKPGIPQAKILVAKSDGTFQPAQTLADAKAAAASGDTIYVQPGSYAATASLLKNGVNWNFAAGAVVTNSVVSNTANLYVFDDAAGAITCRVDGYGDFARDTSAAADATHGLGGVLLVSNASSNVTVRCRNMTATTAVAQGVLDNYTVRQDAGIMHVDCDTILGTNTNATLWANGDGMIRARRIKSTGQRYSVWAVATATPTGSYWVWADEIQSDGTAQPAVTAQGDATARMWVYCNQISGNVGGILSQGPFLYVNAQKVIGKVTNSGGTLYLTAQKSTGYSGLNASLYVLSSGLSYIDVGQLEDGGGSSSQILVAVSGGVHNFKFDTCLRSVTGLGFSCSPGTLNLTPGRISTVGGSNELSVSGGTFNLYPGGSGGGALGAFVTNGAINYASAPNALAALLTVDTDTAGINATTLKSTTPTAAGLTLLDDADATAQRATLGLVIGTNVQAYDADLTTYAGITPAANVQTLLGAADYSAMRTQLSLVPGTNVQAYSSMLARLAAAPVALTDAATIATDASLGCTFTVTLGGNRTLGAPTNPLAGQRCIWVIRQDGTGTRTLAYNAAFRFSAGNPTATVSTAINKTDYFGAIYNGTDSTWDVTSFMTGY